MGTGLRLFNIGKAMVQFTILDDGQTADLAGVILDPADPFSLVYSRRAITAAISETGFRTRLDLVVRTHGSVLDVRMNAADFVTGRNKPITIAERLIREGKDDILDAMIERFSSFMEEELAA